MDRCVLQDPSQAYCWHFCISAKVTALSRQSYAHLDLDAEHTLSEQDVADSGVNKVASRLTGVDHEAVGELHRLCTSSTQFARHDDFATFGARFHDEAKHTIACTVSTKLGVRTRATES